MPKIPEAPVVVILPATSSPDKQGEDEIKAASESKHETGDEKPDPEFLAALPPELRAEIEEQYGISSEATTPSNKGRISPQSVETKKRFARITQSLGPRTGTSVSPLKRSTFFDKRSPKAEEKLNVLDKDLRQLGIDPDVFELLPIEDQREQLSIFQQKKYQS